jgi:FKBP-type peptidyl-prolyl cis-trans isomerase
MRKGVVKMMRIVTLLFVVSGLLCGCDAICKKDIAIKTDVQKASYAIGQQIGQGIKSQGLDADVDIIAMSINDVYKNKPARLTTEDMQQAIKKVQEDIATKQTKIGEENKTKGAAFLEENKKKPNIKTTASGLQYEILKEGKGPMPTDTDKVKVQYKGTLIDGTEFDSSYKRDKPAEFPLNGVIPGWTEALKLMPVGSKWKVYIPSNLAYGERGRPGIPANSVLIFEVELLEILKNG